MNKNQVTPEVEAENIVQSAWLEIRECLNREHREKIISYRELKAGVNNAARMRDAAIEALSTKESNLRAENERLREAGAELLSGHDNLYLAHFEPMFGAAADPRDDIAAKAMRRLLQGPAS